MATKKVSTRKKANGGRLKGRPKPTAPRSWYKASGRRYEEGGKVNR